MSETKRQHCLTLFLRMVVVLVTERDCPRLVRDSFLHERSFSRMIVPA